MKRFWLVVLLCLTLLPLSTAFGQEGDDTPRSTATVTAIQAPLHAEPSTQSEILDSLTEGTLLTDLGPDVDQLWLQVETEGGLTGWIDLTYVRRNGPYIPPQDGLTRNAVDGIADDWARFLQPYEDAVGDSSGNVDIVAVQSFMNQEYLYILVEAEGDLRSAQLILVDLVTRIDTDYFTYQYALPRHQNSSLFVVTEDRGESRDASAVLDYRETAFEMRIPLDILDSPEALNIVAVTVQETVGGALTTTDTLAEVMPTVVTLEAEPVPNATTEDVRANLRAAPVSGAIVRVLGPETEVSIIGRTEDNTWYQLRLNDTWLGWVASQLLIPDPEFDLADVPVTE